MEAHESPNMVRPKGDVVDLIRNEVRLQLSAELNQFYQRIMYDVDTKIEGAIRQLQTGSSLQSVEGGRSICRTPRENRTPQEQLKAVWAGDAQNDTNTYTALTQVTQLEDGEESLKKAQMAWLDYWMETVEAGELDVYTCLGLSNAFTNTPDTRKVWLQAISVTILQLVVPSIMLGSEFNGGLTVNPSEADTGFRFIGAVLYAYSVYTMYNNADGTSRSSLLNLMTHYHNVPKGYWLPLIVGEVLNAFVGMILVLTLYQIYCHQNQPADLILNAVAVNFLGNVDSDFVDPEMKATAIANCKVFYAEHVQAEGEPKRISHSNGATVSWTDYLVKLVLYGIAMAGFVGSCSFLFSATSTEPSIRHTMRHANLPMAGHHHPAFAKSCLDELAKNCSRLG
jgi:hypothetical protein